MHVYGFTVYRKEERNRKRRKDGGREVAFVLAGAGCGMRSGLMMVIHRLHHC